MRPVLLATCVTLGTGAGVAGATRILGSGMTSATAGLLRSALTSEADRMAATELGSVSCSTSLPPLDRMLDAMAT